MPGNRIDFLSIVWQKHNLNLKRFYDRWLIFPASNDNLYNKNYGVLNLLYQNYKSNILETYILNIEVYYVAFKSNRCYLKLYWKWCTLCNEQMSRWRHFPLNFRVTNVKWKILTTVVTFPTYKTHDIEFIFNVLIAWKEFFIND